MNVFKRFLLTKYSVHDKRKTIQREHKGLKVKALSAYSRTGVEGSISE
jgi:hypothetical protein